MRVVLNPDACAGYAYCARFAPALFTVTDGLAALRPGLTELPPDLLAGAEAAAESCPMDAIDVLT
ncbi:ferredoxin [Nonomuraea sp. NBC_01738]|uniref:ferredoxin n=1 Tax=Nonomuraea sp. NBC_01738 TaxID=2976003 RepID=UPI002E12C359|nr:ferredoxin [Nonomuraea sp. NBC_01738]